MFLISLVSFLVLQFFLHLPLVSAASANSPARIADLNVIVENILHVSVALVGALSAVMLVVGGFKYLTASGDKEAAAKAQHTLTFAVVGLLVAASAWLIVSFLGTFLGVDLSTFDIFIH